MKLRFLAFKKSFRPNTPLNQNLFNNITNFWMTRQIFTHCYLLLTYSTPSSWERWSVWRMINCFKLLFPSSLFSFFSTCTSCHWIGGVNQKSTSHLDILLSRRFLIFFSLSSSTCAEFVFLRPSSTMCFVLLLRTIQPYPAKAFSISKAALCVVWKLMGVPICRAKSLFNACFLSCRRSTEIF